MNDCITSTTSSIAGYSWLELILMAMYRHYYKRINLSIFLDHLELVNFKNISDIAEIDSKLCYFNDLLFSENHRQTAIRTVKICRPKAPWITRP